MFFSTVDGRLNAQYKLKLNLGSLNLLSLIVVDYHGKDSPWVLSNYWLSANHQGIKASKLSQAFSFGVFFAAFFQ